MTSISLNEQIKRFTVFPPGGSVYSLDDPKNLVIVPRKCDLQRGFNYAKRLLNKGLFVRLIGDGVTFEHAWPDWAKREKKLLLTELSAYNVLDTSEVMATLAVDIESWLDRFFKGMFEGLSGNKVFYAQACQRLFQPILESQAILRGIVEKHGAVDYYCVDMHWPAFLQLKVLVSKHGGRIKSSDFLRHAVWPFVVSVLGMCGLFFSIFSQTNNFLKSKRSRAEIKKLRQNSSHTHTPLLWVALVPTWFRANTHVLQCVALPQLSKNKELGVLLLNDLNVGQRLENDLEQHIGKELWPGLGELRSCIENCVIEQAVTATSLKGLFSILVSSISRSARLIIRLIMMPARIDYKEFHVDFSRNPLSIVKLITQDVFRTTASEYATRELLTKHSFSGRVVVFCGSNSATGSMINLLLQSAGSTTLEYLHGTGDFILGGWAQDRSSVCCVWTLADSTNISSCDRPIVVAGMPGIIKPRLKSSRAPKNILILSNAVHRDSRVGNRFPYAIFQDELLKSIKLIRKDFGDRFIFRWRPHPADDRKAIERTFKDLECVDLSIEKPLEEDLLWSDLVISSGSSAARQALLADVPVFVQALPYAPNFPIVDGFAPSRCFFWSSELIDNLASCIGAMDRGDSNVLDLEKQTRIKLFGFTGKPSDMDEILKDGFLESLFQVQR